MIEFNVSGALCIQLKSSAAFDGATPAGYASAAYSVGGVVGTFRARLPGSFPNYSAGPPVVGTTVQMVAGLPGLTAPKVQVIPYFNDDGIIGGYAVNIQLVTSAGTITSHLSDVAAALAAYRQPGNDDVRSEQYGFSAGASCPVRLHVATDGVITAADATPHQLASGVEPNIQHASVVRFDMGSTAVGIWAVPANELRVISQVTCTTSLTALKIVNLDDGLGAISGETIDLTALLTSGQFLGGNQEITFDPATQGVLITTAAGGTAQLWIKRASRRP